MIKLTQEQFDNWIKALRSGDYIQGRNNLKIIKEDKPEYCCLGVLCEIMKVPSEEVHLSDGINVYFEEHNTNLPNSVLKDTSGEGLYHRLGEFKLKSLTEESQQLLQPYIEKSKHLQEVKKEERFTLSGLNDSGVPFTVIADIVEKNQQLFVEIS